MYNTVLRSETNNKLVLWVKGMKSNEYHSWKF